jgi:phospholipase D-like protein
VDIRHGRSRGRQNRSWRAGLGALIFLALAATRAAAADQIYFAATDNITNVLVQKINAETVRIDMSCWYLSEHSISIALINKFLSGVPVRLIGDRGSIFEIDAATKNEFYWLANQGLPIRLRFNPTWYPEIDHWKATVFVGQNLVAFGSANYAPVELAPASPTNYADETVMVSDDPTLVNAFKTKFDTFWNDTTAEPESLVPSPPYFKNWNDACINEPTGCDYFQKNPNPAPMTINTARLEANNPIPADLIFGQGPDFNNRLVQEINNEPTSLQFVIYRLTVDNITQALLNRFQAGVQMQVLVEPSEYLNTKWPEFWLTHANLDKLWAAGIPMKQRAHDGLTHMKTLVTSTFASNASSNYAAAWQRDNDYFVSAATKPTIYGAIKNRVTAMWNDSTAFAPFAPQPPFPPTLAAPASGATGVSTTPTLTWNIATFAVSYDVFLGTSSSAMSLVGNVPAQMVNNPPATYSWTASTPLAGGTTYFWKIVSRTNATPKNAAMIGTSPISSFTTAGSVSQPPGVPGSPNPANGATNVATNATLTWSASGATTYDVKFGTANPPPQVSSAQAAASYTPTLAASQTYFWQIVARNSAGTTAGPVWSFATGASAPPPGLPSPWVSQDVGSVGVAGSASFSNGTFTIAGAGADIWGNADSFRYTSQPISGDGQIVARVVGIQNTNTFAKAGVMLRESTAAGSVHVILDTRPDGSIEFMTRSATGGATTFIAGGSQPAPQWLRLTRSGNTVTGSTSANGSTWTTIGTATASMAASATIGLAVTSHDTSTLNTSTFDNVTVSTAGPPPPPPPPPPSGDVVIYASDIPAGSRHGSWTTASDATSPNGVELATPDAGVANTANALASPTDFVDVTFSANAGTPYTIWLRLKALANSKFNDSIWVQFSDAQVNGSSIYPLNSTSGLLVNLATDSTGGSLNNWGWQNTAYWLSQPTTVTFPTTGTHTLRIQVREDGVQFDQVVLSPSTFLTSPPGPVSGDSTIVPKP